MTEQKPARPATLRTVPQPAPDEEIDPVDLRPTAKKAPRGRKVASAKVEAVLDVLPAPKQQPVAVFPFSTRLSQEVMDILKTITDTGVSQRAAVEHAIRVTYGQVGK